MKVCSGGCMNCFIYVIILLCSFFSFSFVLWPSYYTDKLTFVSKYEIVFWEKVHTLELWYTLLTQHFILASSRGSGKHPQLIPSTPRWAVANGAGVILSVCDEEVARYETATLTAAAVPALLLPPPTTPMDEHLVAGLPALEPYARLFHR